jgi:hypothetical protein
MQTLNSAKSAELGAGGGLGLEFFTGVAIDVIISRNLERAASVGGRA